MGSIKIKFNLWLEDGKRRESSSLQKSVCPGEGGIDHGFHVPTIESNSGLLKQRVLRVFARIAEPGFEPIELGSGCAFGHPLQNGLILLLPTLRFILSCGFTPLVEPS